jgi:predicted fused transcriptional regulator/phosphomethylpyrimidine kinase/predicted transcriptional regulator
MKFIEEVVVEQFLPTVRSMLAEQLRDRDLTQQEVASVLGISQSAVSKYAHGEVARQEAVLTDPRVEEVVEHVAEGLATGDMSRVQALAEMEVLIRRLEDGDLLARLHQEVVPELADADVTFDVHDPDSALRTSEEVLSSVRRGLRTLTATGGFAGLIPNVGSNLVESLPETTDIDDVAGVPGRIFDVKGRATVPADPEFGVSEHVASVLLSARSAGVSVRAALNIRYDPALLTQLREAGYETVEFAGDGDLEQPNRTAEDADSIATALSDRDVGEKPFVLYQTGGQGIEPIIYVLGADAPTVVTVVRDLV